MKAWFARLNQRERYLVLAVAAVVFLLGNLFWWTWFFNAERDLRAEVGKRKAIRREQTIYLRDADLWARREAWLKQHQPAFHGAADASTLLDQLKQAATKNNIVIENPSINTGEATGAYQSIFATIETKSPWPPLVHFLYDVQTPESFIVFENVDLRVDPSDATQMRGKFRIARWAAQPNSPAK